MNVQYVVVYKLRGASGLEQTVSGVQLLASASPILKAFLTDDPELHFTHMDKATAIAAQLFNGILGKCEGDAKKLAADLEKTRTQRLASIGKGVFLVFEGEFNWSNPSFKARRDMDNFSICLDDFDKQAIRETFAALIESVLAALSLSMEADVDPLLTKIGEVIYLIDSKSGKPIYPFEISVGAARLSLARVLTPEVVTSTCELVQKLAGDKAMARSIHLLMRSLEESSDKLQAFLAAWSSLEIFVSAAFKSTYDARWSKIMEQGAPESAQRVFRRLSEVMRDKYRLADKFLVISSMLDPADAADDSSRFDRWKRSRDEFLHGSKAVADPLPTHDVQKLLIKYMKLHVRRQQ